MKNIEKELEKTSQEKKRLNTLYEEAKKIDPEAILKNKPK